MSGFKFGLQYLICRVANRPGRHPKPGGEGVRCSGKVIFMVTSDDECKFVDRLMEGKKAFSKKNIAIGCMFSKKPPTFDPRIVDHACRIKN